MMDKRGSTSRLAAGLLLVGALGACAATTERPRPSASLGADLEGVPKALRYVSAAAGTKGRFCYGAVVASRDGMPEKVQLLRVNGDPICDPAASDTPALAAQRLRDALTAAETAPAPQSGRPALKDEEMIRAEDRASRILPPVVVQESWLEPNQEQVFIVAVAINYREHAEETAQAKSLLFPKPVVPTGAYGILNVSEEGPPIGPGNPLCLLDYEVEIGFVALEDIPLATTIPDLRSKVAFFNAADVSDRAPIILDPDDKGYTKAKGRRGFLPSGPWLVRGTHLFPDSADAEDARELGLELATLEADQGSNGTWYVRQAASSNEMMRGPAALLKALSALADQGERCADCTMEDDEGHSRAVIRGNVFPAGSIMLTGTPGGTAIKAPNFPEFVIDLGRKLGLNRRKLKGELTNIDELGYLESGDQVDQVITGLGRQRWEVQGTATLQACEDYAATL